MLGCPGGRFRGTGPPDGPERARQWNGLQDFCECFGWPWVSSSTGDASGGILAAIMRRPWAFWVVALVACRPEAPFDEPTSAEPVPEVGPAGAVPPEASPPARGTAPDPDVPGLVVRNLEDVGIEIYAAYIVDRRGELGTRVLWPHPSDCPDVKGPARLVAGGGGTRWLPPPIEAYVPGQCMPSPLPLYVGGAASRASRPRERGRAIQ